MSAPVVSGGGLSIDVPPGWDVRIRPGGPGGTDYVVAHGANFALPAQREDFGGELVGDMTSGQVFVAVLGYGTEYAGRGLFEPSGSPSPLDPAWFDPFQMQRPYRGMAGVQRFFTAQGRAYCLYAVIGSYARRSALVPLVNSYLAGVGIGSTPAAAPASAWERPA